MNRSVVLDDPQAVLDDNALPAVPNEPPRAKTPPITDPSDRDVVFQTPQKSRDILEAIKGDVATLTRHLRTVHSKSAKAIDQKNAEIAALHEQLHYYKTREEAHKPRGKRKVKEGGNDKFTRIEEILEARDASQQGPKRRKVATTTTATNLHEVERVLASTLQTIQEHED